MKLSIDRPRLALLLLAALLGVGIWAYRGVGDSLRELRATSMVTLLNTQIEALDQWIAEGRHKAEQLATDAELSAAVGRLIRQNAGGAEGGRIIERLLQDAGGVGITAAHAIDGKGIVLASSDAARIGQAVTPDFFANLAPVLAGRSVFIRPYRGGAMGKNPMHLGRVWVAAPVRDAKGKVLAVLALGSPADAGFADLFKAARPGSSGESFSIDAEGWLGSESRHIEEQ
ncbi:MAG: cache domain-containing protein, partial [Sulfuritalea sp.]|nr:cache domain-containing protein [Sulfuritalea sp.]